MDDAARLLDSLSRQRDRYASVAGISERQRALLESNDMDALIDLIDQKRRLLLEIESIKKETADLMERWPSLRASAPAETVRGVEAVVEETRALLERILRIEEEDRARFEQGRQERADELRKLQMRKKMRDAYGQKGSADPGVVDDKK